MKHLADVERSWFREVFAGEDLSHLWDASDPQRFWRIEPDDTTEGVLALYRAEVERARAVVAGASMDDVAAAAPSVDLGGVQLRWIVAHMIEETGRHCGHADLIREAIDGQVGE